MQLGSIDFDSHPSNHEHGGVYYAEAAISILQFSKDIEARPMLRAKDGTTLRSALIKWCYENDIVWSEDPIKLADNAWKKTGCKSALGCY